MKPVITILVSIAWALVVACSGSNPQPAQAAAVGCFGAKVDAGYVSQYATLRGPSTPSSIEYPEARFYREIQSWATRVGEDPGHHSEHMHIAACFPNGQTMTGPFDIDFVVTFHNFADYQVLSASMAAVTQQSSDSLWSATPAQVAQLQAAADASGDGSVQKVYFSVHTNAPTHNGFTEIRGALHTQEDGPTAIFHTWHFDPRWYVTYNVAGLPSSTFQASQMAIRSRSQLTWHQADGTLHAEDYHHSGWCGMDGIDHLNPSIPTDCASKNWTSTEVGRVWPDTADKSFTLYVTDGGGDAYVMIDPDFHNHYHADGTSDTTTNVCANVDANGNCLGQWFWRPDNARQEIFGSQFPVVTIPAAVVASLAQGIHRLAFLSSDAPECERLGNPCPDGTRGEWSNVEVLPFRVN